MRRGVKEFIADTLAMIVFSTVVGMTIEIGLAGISLEKSIAIRSVAVFTNILTGGLNGMWLNKVRNAFRAEKHWSLSLLADLSAFVTFQALIYTVNLTYTEVTIEQGVKAVASAAVVCVVAGKPYGWCVDLARKLVSRKGKEYNDGYKN